MVIGIDIDDTLVQTNKRALELIKRDNLEPDISYYEELSDMSSFIHNYFKEIVQTAELFEDAREVVNALHSQGNRIVFVTSRAHQGDADTEEDTIDYLKEKGVNYDLIYLKTPDKLDVCLKENVDIFIDDKEKTLIPLSEAGIRCIKMTSHEKGTSQFETVQSWEEIGKLLLKRLSK